MFLNKNKKSNIIKNHYNIFIYVGYNVKLKKVYK